MLGYVKLLIEIYRHLPRSLLELLVFNQFLTNGSACKIGFWVLAGFFWLTLQVRRLNPTGETFKNVLVIVALKRPSNVELYDDVLKLVTQNKYGLIIWDFV